jgi:glutamyl-tRNA reductase
MMLRVVGCSHHTSNVEVRERLAFSPDQLPQALLRWRDTHPDVEAVLLSTCNRTEFYTAAESLDCLPSRDQTGQFLASCHGLNPAEILDQLFERTGAEAVRHLFTVAASMDSMVVGEAQILSQVKQAFAFARENDFAGPLAHRVFEAANRVAKRVANETSIARRRVSIPSVAVADYAKGLFESFDDKRVLLIGAGEMGHETLTYLIDEGVRDVVIINRNRQRAEHLATQMGARAESWDQIEPLMVWADLVISTTGAQDPIVTADRYRRIDHDRAQRLLFILDLAVPRDFDPEIERFNNVYLYSIDDLQAVCERNRRAREKQWPKANRIIQDETDRFMAELNRRQTGPTIKQLKDRAEQLKSDELQRLQNKLGEIDDGASREIERSFDRLVNKLLHPPLESLREEAYQGSTQGLLDALRRLFQIND